MDAITLTDVQFDALRSNTAMGDDAAKDRAVFVLIMLVKDHQKQIAQLQAQIEELRVRAGGGPFSTLTPNT